MCRTWNITYTCKHTFQFRLSTCRGTFTIQTKPGREPKATCSSWPFLTFCSPSKCGLCLLSEAEKENDALIQGLRTRLICGSPELAVAEADHLSKVWTLPKRFPKKDKRFAKSPRPHMGLGTARPKTSLLRHEVLPEDVVLQWEPVKSAIGGGWDSWDKADYPDLGVEIAEDESKELEGFEEGFCPVEDERAICGNWDDWEKGDYPDLGDEIAEDERKKREWMNEVVSTVEDELASLDAGTEGDEMMDLTLEGEDEDEMSDRTAETSSTNDVANVSPTTAAGASDMKSAEQEMIMIKPGSNAEIYQVEASIKPRVTPPHELRGRRRRTMLAKSTTENSRTDVDLRERVRCLQYSVAFST